MNSLQNFYKFSTQFKNISNKLFNNSYKIDHYAYRTFDIDTILQKYPDYKLEKDKYEFSNNVSARWLSKENNPSIFVSQYNGILNDKNIKETSINLDKLNFYMRKSEIPEFSFYKQINDYDQYLGWTLLFKNQINHIAFLVDDIEETHYQIENKFPEYDINNSDNPIQISKDKNLLQFSIMSETIPFRFLDLSKEIPFTFIEFVERKNNRVGFESQNAEKIFDSTKFIKSD